MGRDSPAIPPVCRVGLIAAFVAFCSPATAQAVVIAAPMTQPQLTTVVGNIIYLGVLPAPSQPLVLRPANNPVVTIIRPPVATPGVFDNCGQRLAAPSTMLDWMDVQHCRFSGHTTSTVTWFDHLFGNTSPDKATVLLRVITEEQYDKKNGDQFVTSVQASVHLPNADQRLRLVISDDRQDLVGGDKNISPEQQRQQSAATTAALRFLAYAHDTLRLDTDIGLRSGPDLFARARVRDVWTLTPDSSLSASQTVRYAVEDEGRTISEMDLNRLLGQSASVALTNQFSWWEKEDHEVGARWNQGVSYRQEQGQQQYWSFGVGTEGVTRPVFERNSYGVWALWRRLLWHDWIYYEVEPRLTRYRQFDWDVDPSITLRLELQFGRK